MSSEPSFPRPYPPMLIPALVLVVLLVTTGPSRAHHAIQLEDTDSSLQVYSRMDILEDSSGRVLPEDVLAGKWDGQFRPSGTSPPSFGFTSSVYWIRFTLEAQPLSGEWFLAFGYPLLDDVRLYTATRGERYSEQRSGDLVPWRLRAIPHREPVFSIHPHGRQTYYCRIQTTSSLIINPVLWSAQGFHHFQGQENFLLGIYYGIIIVMSLYNLFLFLTLREPPYLFYVFYILVYGVFQACLNGISGRYLWPDSTVWNNISTPFFIGMSCLMCLLFTRSFLHVTNRPLRNTMNILAMLCIIQSAASCVMPYAFSIRFGSHLAIIVLTVMIFAGLHSLYCRYRPARYFLLAWGIFISGQFVSALHKSYALFPTNFFTLHSDQLGSMFDVILLSLALADRIRTIQEEREKAQEDSLRAFSMTEELNDKLKEINRTLESKVEERTVELTMANEKLRELDRLKSAFLANVSHELRTPLTSIYGFATIIQDKLERLLIPAVNIDTPEVARASRKSTRDIGIIIGEARRLTTLIDDLLDLSKMEAGRMEWRWRKLRLSDVVQNTMDSIRPLFEEKDLELRLEVTGPIPFVWGDQDRLQQVVLNLLSNAAKYTEQGWTRCRVEPEQDGVRVSVEDSGRGIPESEQETVFDQFRRVQEAPEEQTCGTGLGLSICREIVEHHGGSIGVRSIPGQGSEFFFTIPEDSRNRRS